MKQQFKLYRRSNGKYYAENTTTGKQSSLGTRDKAEANRLLHARNEAAYQPAFNKQMAKTYLAAGDPRAIKGSLLTFDTDSGRVGFRVARDFEKAGANLQSAQMMDGRREPKPYFEP